MYKHAGAGWRLRPLRAADCSPCLTIFRESLSLLAGHGPGCGVARGLLEAVRPAAKRPLSLDVHTEEKGAQRACHALSWQAVAGAASDSRARQMRLVSA